MSIFLVAFAKFLKATIILVMSVCPRGKTRFLLDGFSWNSIFENFTKICWEKFSFG